MRMGGEGGHQHRGPIAVAAVTAIRDGDQLALRSLLADNPSLATARLGDDDPQGMSRTLLHVVTDWPGHFPHGAATVVTLVKAGADVNARFRGPFYCRSGSWSGVLVGSTTLGGAKFGAPATIQPDVPSLPVHNGVVILAEQAQIR